MCTPSTVRATRAAGVQSDEYRTADPRELVQEDGTVMAAPAGAPQEDASAEERRAEDRS
jgi:hypothetical protein